MKKVMLTAVALGTLALAGCDKNRVIWDNNGVGEGDKKVWDNPDANRTQPKSIWTKPDGTKVM